MNQYANDFTSTVKIYYDDLKKYKPLTKAKEKRLLKLSRKGNLKAKNEILEANLKFVFDIAKHYTGRGLSISELISEGNMGLLRAIEKFDEEKDIKFISYAVWWIRQAMLEAIKKKKMLMMVEIDPTDSNDNIFERKIADDEDERIGGASDVGFSNEAEEYKKELKANQKEVIGKLLNSLNSREKEIIEHYYGLSNKRELTLNEIGKKYNLSSERVRQVKLTAIRKLRSSMMMYDDMEELLS
jgi:RNA polymerase primary sigma factor